MKKEAMQRIERLKHKLRVGAAVLLATGSSTLGLAQAKPDNSPRDDKQQSPIESSFSKSDQLSYSVEDISKVAQQMYVDAITNYIGNYLDETYKDIQKINKERKAKNLNKVISTAIGKKRINNLGQHCAEAGTFQAFMQEFSPHFLTDSIYRELQNPNYAPTIFSDVKKVAKKYSSNPDKFFVRGNANIYKQILNYNLKNNQDNLSKMFLCHEKNGGGHHFTIVCYDGNDYTRVSFNGEDIRDLSSYTYGRNRTGEFVDITGILGEYCNYLVKQSLTEVNQTAVSKDDANQLVMQLQQVLSSDTYVVDPQHYHQQLEQLAPASKYNEMLSSSNIKINIQKLSENEFQSLANANDTQDTVSSHLAANVIDIPSDDDTHKDENVSNITAVIVNRNGRTNG